jgi:ubiquinone/menaquinone biosynthesis C-methylase UbiE
MPSTFNARDAEAYERVMGRWSRRLAGPFLDFAGVMNGDVLDVGCGTGSLTFPLAERAPAVTSIAAVDIAPSYVAYARAHNRDPRIAFEQADAGRLPFPAGRFDHCLSLLALHLMSDPARAVAEMVRVTRPSGTIAGAVWDVRGGLPNARLFLDTAAMFDPAAVAVRNRYMTVPLTQAGELEALWRAHGLQEITQATVSVRFDFSDFADYWEPFRTGEGTMGGYVATLDTAASERLGAHVRAAYEAGAPDGARSFVASAWLCRGTVSKAAGATAKAG